MMKLAVVLIALASAWGQDTGSIEGLVTNAITHAPLANVRVTIDRAAVNQSLQRSTVTDGSGAYSVDGLPAGDYVATFVTDSYVSSASPVVRLSSTVLRVNAELWPAATVHGRVVDDEGQPAQQVPVELYRYRGGRPTIVKTDAEGHFAFDKVAQGVYAVAVRPDPKRKDGTALAPTWFPGFTDRTQAERVIVRPGAEISGLEIRLRRVPVWNVEGTVSDETGRALSGVTVKLQPTDEWQPAEADTVTGEDGAYHFSGVRPGEWRLSAQGSGRQGFGPVAVEKHDVERVTIKLLPPFALEGFVDRDEPRDADGKRKVSGVSLVAEGGQGKGELAFHQQDGSIRFPRVQPGRYTIFPLGYIPGYYVESVKLGDREVMGRPVDLTDGVIPFSVVYRNNAGRVRGSVEKCGTSTVTLLPQDESLLDGQYIRTAKCDASGRFEVGSLKPGEYFALAFDRIDSAAFTDVAFVRNLRAAAVLVHVEAGQAADVELKVTPWPE